MAVMNVTRLPDFGYKGLETPLEDPMDTRFLAKPYAGTDLEQIRSELLPSLAGLNAYPDAAILSAMQERYWADKAKPAAADTGAKTSGQVDSAMLEAHNSHHGGGAKGM